jgi:hypothetical protein
MIDFTKIQTVPVPPPIKVLQVSNGQLKLENNGLKKTIIVLAAIAFAVVVVIVINKLIEDEESKRRTN